MGTEPLLKFVEHPDVVFSRAPLELVLCQLRFPPIFALMDEAGVTGFQEAVRRVYPRTSADREVEFSVGPHGSQLAQKAPIWKLKDEDEQWTVSLAVDFVALETPDYPDFGEFKERLRFILSAIERTVSPGRTTRVGLRKINNLSHPSVTSPRDWVGLVRSEVVGMLGVELPGGLRRSFTELRIDDENAGNLLVRYGIEPESPKALRLDMDYSTTRGFAMNAESQLVERVEAYSHSMTSLFHWMIEPTYSEYLDPQPRVGKGDS